MLVDDEIDIIGLFTEILTLNGISVRPFTNPKEALDDFEQSHDNYRLVISDVRMSPMSGVEFVAKIKEIDSEVHFANASLLEAPLGHLVAAPICHESRRLGDWRADRP